MRLPVILLLVIASLLPAVEIGTDTHRVEPLLRALQERYHAITGSYITLPRGGGGVPLSDDNAFPPDGFYDGISETQVSVMAHDIITHIRGVVAQFKDAPDPEAEFLEMPSIEGLPPDQAFTIAMDALRECRFLHFGPGGHALPVQGKIRRIDIHRATVNPSIDVEWFNAGIPRTIGSQYDRKLEVTHDYVYALSLRTVGSLVTGLAGGYWPLYSTIGTGFEYGFDIQYDLGAWSQNTIQPYFSITWYSGLGNTNLITPVWPSAPNVMPVEPPLWIPNGYGAAEIPDPAFWITPDQRQRGPVSTSEIFPTSPIPCSDVTHITLNFDYDYDSIGYTGTNSTLTEPYRTGYFYQIDYHGFIIDLQDTFEHPVPTHQPLTVAEIYPGTCPEVLGTIAKGFSIIDNGSMTYYHDAWDYAPGDAAGCGSCGGSVGSVTGSVALTLGRIHRYRDLDWGASFGPGVLCNHDLRVQLFADASGGIAGRFFDPLQRVVCELSASTGSAVLSDPASVARHLTIQDGEAVPTADLAQARQAVLELFDGRTLVFDLFPLQAGDVSALAGRLRSVQDQQNQRLDVTYSIADAWLAMADAATDASALWCFHTITDQRGVTAAFTWIPAAGQWVIASATMPGGGVFAYAYGDTGLVSLQDVTYPTGEASHFAAQWEGDDQWVGVDIEDAGATTTHRKKRVSLTPSLESGFAGGARVQLPNLVRRVVNGQGELSYRNWLDVQGDQLDFYTYTGGGQGGAGVLRWLRYQDGRPASARIAERYLPGQPFSSHTWLTNADYATDAHMRPAETRAPDGTFTTYERDGRGNITARIQHRPDGSEISRVTTTYDDLGNPLDITDELGRLTRNVYDARGLLTSRTVAVGTADAATWGYDYDDQGRLIAQTDANGNVTDFEYDPVTGQVAAIVEPGDTPLAVRSTRRFTYDEAGRPLTSSDQAGRTVTFAYDGRGRPSTTTYADGTTEEVAYGTGDDANLVTARKDRNGIWEQLAYDAAGRQTSSVLNAGQPDQVVRTWAYLPGQSLVARETVNGTTTAYDYDAEGRVAAVTTWSTPVVAHTSQSELWEAERVSVSVDADGHTSYTLESLDDQNARVVRELRPGALAAIAGPAVGNRAQRAAALWALTRPSGANPAYAITETQYDVAGQVIAQIDAAGLVSGMLYDSQGRPTVTTVVDSVSGQEIRTVVAYDPQGNRTRVVSPRSFGDDAPGVFETRTAYTGRNLVASQTDSFIPDPESGTDLEAITVTTHFTYTPTGKKQSESNPRNAAWVTQYIYGVCCDRLEQVIDAGGFVTRYAYDAMGRMLGTTDANGNASSTQYDAQGRVIARTDAQGAVTAMAYDDDLSDGTGLDEIFSALVADLGFGTGAAGSATLTTGPTGEQTLVIRDSLGRTLRQVVGAETATPTVTTTLYDATTDDGLQVVTLIDTAGAVAKQYLDGSGRVVRAELPGGAVVAAQYDPQGQPIAQTDPNGVTTQSAYDDLGRPVSVTDGGGSTIQRVYDVNGNVLEERDAFGNAIVRVYDGLNRLIRETDRLGNTTTFTYTLAGQIETITDALGGVTEYVYDERNALVSETFPGASGGTRSRTFDAAGRLQSSTDQRGIVTTLTYDATNQVTQRAYSTGHADSFTYDDAGRLLTATSGRYGTTITRSYADGLLHQERQEGPHGSATVTYHYDAQRRPVLLTLDDGTELAITIDARGQITDGSIDGATVFTRTFDDGGRILDTQFPNGVVERRTYTAANQLAGVHIAAAPAAPVVDLSVTYDANRRKVSEVDAAEEAYQATQNFGYDANDRLVGWERTPRPQAPPLLPEPDSADTQTWDLDALGNWSTTTRNGVTEVREHSPVHAITTIADVPLFYDANGNLTQDHRGRVSTWDEDNRLVSVSVHDADENVSGTATMVYDALGRRLARTAFGRTTVFVLNGSQVIQERDTAAVVPQADVVSDGTRPDPVNPGPAPEGAILDLPGSWHITHQPSWTGIPTGWMADKGRALAERTHGLTYGWERGGSPQALSAANSFQRGLMPQPELDTLHRLSEGDASATWRCVLPNGNYAVVVVSGDAQTRAHTNHWLFNGQALIDPDPYDPDFNPGYSGGDFDGWAVDVVVEDGFLTLAPGPGAFDPRLCLIEIGPPGSAVDDDLRAKLAGIIERATRRSEGGALHPPSPRTYAYGGDYIDAPLAMRVGSGGTAQTYFVHTNHLYSPQALTDASGQVVERYSYTAYGERTVLGGTSLAKSSVGFHHGFTGLRNEGHLLFARNRYFAPEMGRWTSRDPAGYVDGYALYNGYFVPNAMDPEGKFAFLVGFIIPFMISDIPGTFWAGIQSSPRDLAYGLKRVGTGLLYSAGSIFDPEMRVLAINRGRVDREIWEMAEWLLEDPQGFAKVASIVVENQVKNLWNRIPEQQRQKYISMVLESVGEYGAGRMSGNITINLLTQKAVDHIAANIAGGMAAAGIGSWRKFGGSIVMGSTIMAYQLYGAAQKMEQASARLRVQVPFLWNRLESLHHTHYLYGFIEPVIQPLMKKTADFITRHTGFKCYE